jgi:pimeloyl-ACP methyl ester carboxylesterase
MIHYSKSGNGPALLLIHGFCETHEVWSSLTPLLTNDFTVYAIDLPGFGQSDPLPEGFSLAAVASHVRQWVRKESLYPFLVVGHSLGGYVVMEWLAQFPMDAEAYLLFHSSFFEDAPERKEGRTKSIDFVAKNGVGPFVKNLIPNLFYQKLHPALPQMLEIASKTTPSTVMEYTRAMRDRIDHGETAKVNTGKLFYLFGEFDPIIPVEAVKKMTEIATPRMVDILPETGHMGMLESPMRAARFIKSITAR